MRMRFWGEITRENLCIVRNTVTHAGRVAHHTIVFQCGSINGVELLSIKGMTA